MRPGAQGRKKQEIRFRRSLLRFAVLFAVVFVAGLSTRVALNNYPLLEKLNDSIESPDHFRLRFHNPSFQFHSGLLPTLGLQLPRVELIHKKCSTRKLILHNTFVGLNFWKLMRGRFQPGLVEVNFVDIEYGRHCEEPDLQMPVQTASSSGSESSPKKSESLPDPSLKQVNEVFEFAKAHLAQVHFSHLKINEFRFQWLESLHKEFVVSGGVNLYWQDKWRSEFSIQSIKLNDHVFDFLTSDLSLDLSKNLIDLNWRSSIREGRLSLHIDVKNQSDYPTQVKLVMEKLPLSPLTPLFDLSSEIHFLWVNCGGGIQAPFAKIQTTAFVLDPCEVDGPFGKVVVDEVQATLKGVDNFKVRVEKLNLDKILKKKRELYFSGVLSQFGHLNAKVDYRRPRLKINGELGDLEFLFSNNNLRDIQKVTRLPFEISGDLKNWQLKISEMEIAQGEFAGNILLQSENYSEQARGRIAIHKVMLEPKIYKLMLKSQASPFTLYSSFEYLKGKFEHWKAVVATPSLSSEFYTLKNLKVKAEGAANRPAITHITAGRGEIISGSPVVEWLKPTLLNPEWLTQNQQWRELSFHLQVFPDRKVTWKRGYLRLANGWQLSSEGERQVDRNFSAWLQWDGPSGNILKWQFNGPALQGQFTPESPFLKKWLDDHPQFLQDYKSIQYQAQKPTSLGERINKVGKKAIEKAKDLLKKEKSNEGS